ncbi:MAG: GIY-YIG nuclease family protein [Ignavibacteria bacterium]|nr:GIY-YIG nuclease family protein [Ignavibacteria bacterium]
MKKTKMGVFRLKNTVNKKIFIEGSVNLEAVWNRHKMQLKSGRHPNPELQKDWNKYGESKFTYEILKEIKHSETEHINYNMEVNTLVDSYMNELQPFGDKGYNRRNR